MAMGNGNTFKKVGVYGQPSIFKNMKKSVVTAIKAGNLDALNDLINALDQGADRTNVFDLLSKNKKRFVIAAIEAGNLAILEDLLDKKFDKYGVDVTAKNKKQFIVAAIKAGKPAIVKALTDRVNEADFMVMSFKMPFVDVAIENKKQFIVSAIKAGKPAIVKAMIDRVNEADFIVMNSKIPFVDLAIRAGNLGMVNVLLNKLSLEGAKALLSNGSLVALAIRVGYPNILKALLDKLHPDEVNALISEGNLVEALHKGLAVFKVIFEKLCQGQGGAISYERLLKILPKKHLVNEVCRTGDVGLMMFVFGHRPLLSNDKDGGKLDPNTYKLFSTLLSKRIPPKAWLDNSCAQAFLTTVQKLKSQVEIEKKQSGFRSFWRKVVSFFAYGRESKEKCLKSAGKIDLFDIVSRYTDADLKTFASKIESDAIASYLRELLSSDSKEVVTKANRLLKALPDDRVVEVLDTATLDLTDLTAFISKIENDTMKIYIRETDNSIDSKEVVNNSPAEVSRVRSRSEGQGKLLTSSLSLFSFPSGSNDGTANVMLSPQEGLSSFAAQGDGSGAGMRCRAGTI